MSTYEDVNWEVVTVEELCELHKKEGKCFEVNNGKVTAVTVEKG